MLENITLLYAQKKKNTYTVQNWHGLTILLQKPHFFIVAALWVSDNERVNN